MDSFIKLSVVLALVVLGFFKTDQYILKINLKESLKNKSNNLCLTHYQSIDPDIDNESKHTSMIYMDNNSCTANFFTRKLSATQIFGGNCKAIRMSWEDNGMVQIICSRIPGKTAPILKVEKYKTTDISYQFVN